jgi:hypothetical protein
VDSRCGAPDSGCAGRLAGALTADGRQPAGGVPNPARNRFLEATRRNASRMLAPPSAIRSASIISRTMASERGRGLTGQANMVLVARTKGEAIQVDTSVKAVTKSRQTRRGRAAGPIIRATISQLITVKSI